MPSLINLSQQNKVIQALANLHDTFSREITVYKNAKKIAISTSPQFNSIYGNMGSSNSIDYETVSAKFMARVYYLKSEEEHFAGETLNRGSQNKIIMPQGSVKIIVDPDGYHYIKEARKVEFDGITFSIRSDGNPMGLFSNQYYEFFLTPIDE